MIKGYSVTWQSRGGMAPVANSYMWCLHVDFWMFSLLHQTDLRWAVGKGREEGHASWCWSLSIGVGERRWSRMRRGPRNWRFKMCYSQCDIILPYFQPSRWHTLNCKVHPINMGHVIAHALVCPSALLLCNRGSKSVRTEMCSISLHMERPQLNDLYKP